MAKVLILVASLGENVEIGKTLADVVSAQGGDPEIINIVDLDLPLYSTRTEAGGVPDAAKTMADSLSDSRALIVVAPEYNGSMPPVLNNMIAWVSCSGNEDWRRSFNAKIVAIATFSGGAGTSVLAAMRAQFSYLGANVIGRQITANQNKPLNRESATAVVAQVLALSK